MRRLGRSVLGLAALAGGGAILACAGGPDAPPGAVHVLTADGVVNPVMARYIDRGIDHAEGEEAGAVVVRLNTPGGLSSSMDDISERIIGAEVPVIVYVWPGGGQAASAGTFITYAAHVAAMAPGTVIGSATPVGAGGEDIQGDLGNKVLENAVAKIRSYAELRGRNAGWAEDAVREGISASATEAETLGVVDFVATDLQDLLEKADGREVTVEPRRPVILETAEAPVVYNGRTFAEDFLDIIADPNIAFLLLSIGTLALFIEILHPGGIAPGVIGVISLILAFFSLSVIPFNWAGVALIVVAFALFALELFLPSGGILGIGGLVALVLGGFMLTTGNPPGFEVSPWLIIALSAVVAAFVLFVMANVLRIRRMQPQGGMETMVGLVGTARSPLAPEGFVFVNGEYWRAEAEDGAVEAGEQVVVTDMQGLKLRVRKYDREGAKT